MLPRWRSGRAAVSPEVVSPLQPNHSPPFRLSASRTPAARPPLVGSPSVIGATRLETTINRPVLAPVRTSGEGRELANERMSSMAILILSVGLLHAEGKGRATLRRLYLRHLCR